MNVSWLDLKLGIRMLAKYPGLSAVAVIGLALAIAIGATYFGILGAVLDSTLPVDDGDRAVAILTRTVAGPETGGRAGLSPHDFLEWRTGLRSITELGAFREDSRNLVTANGRTYLVRLAAITASGFRLMRVPPLLGRTLHDEDERPHAPPVVVIGYDEWRGRFNADPHLVGSAVHLDGTTYTVVGVMPEGFAFPVRHHYWVPLRLTAADTSPAAEPSLQVFGRVADGFSLAEARAELAAAGERMAVAFPQSHANVRPQALPYTRAFIGIEGPEMELTMRSLQLGVGLLLLIVAVNVAILVYARTATRTGEIVVRTALGASRIRVVSQLFVEALVLTGSAAAIGLTIVVVVFAVLREYGKHSPDMADRSPFWFQVHLTPGVTIYVALLAVVAAVVVGVLPALKATGKNMHARLQQFSSRGSGMQLGRTWTALIVVQVAIAVAVLPAAIHNAQESVGLGMRAAAPAAGSMLRGTLQMSGEGVSPARLTDRITRLLHRLEAEPEVTSVTFAQISRTGAFRDDRTEGSGQIHAGSTQLATTFEVFDVRLLAGRGFCRRRASGFHRRDRRPGFRHRARARRRCGWPARPLFAAQTAMVGSSRVHCSNRRRRARVCRIVQRPKRLRAPFPAAVPPPGPRHVGPRDARCQGQGRRSHALRAAVSGNCRVRRSDAEAERPTSVVEFWNHDIQAFSMLAIVIRDRKRPAPRPPASTR